MINLSQIVLIISSLAIGLYLLVQFFNHLVKRKIKRKLIASWGEEVNKFRNFDRISSYSQLTADRKLATKTVSDLNMNDVYSKMDRCQTKIGQQYLYFILQTPTDDFDVLQERKRLIDVSSTKETLRIDLEYELLKLEKHLGYSLPRVFLTPQIRSFDNKMLIGALSIAPLIIIGFGVLVSSKFYLLLAVSFLVNFVFHYRNKTKVDEFIRPFSQINKIRDCALALSKKDSALHNSDVQLACKKLGALGRYQFLLSSGQYEHDPFSYAVWLVLEYIKIIFLVEINLLDKCFKLATSLQVEMHTVYRFLGLTDACISIASYRKDLDYFCEPTFVNGTAQVNVEDAYHPLVKNCVPNSLSTNRNGILITGSNMSGKTTFIKTIALNSILAQTIFTTCAKSYNSSFLNVVTSIGISDDILLGKSYYLEEIESVYSFIEESAVSQTNNLFVIDELFKGTNTVERIAAAQAVLAYLVSEQNIVIVSTHDLELASILSNQFDLYNFTENVSSLGLEFDHKIKVGILKTRNAIRLLELFQFPSEIVKSANQYIDKSRL